MAMRTSGIMYFLDFKGLSGFFVDSFEKSVFIKNPLKSMVLTFNFTVRIELYSVVRINLTQNPRQGDVQPLLSQDIDYPTDCLSLSAQSTFGSRPSRWLSVGGKMLEGSTHVK